MKYHPFTIPFSIGLLFVFIYIVVRYTLWIRKLDATDKQLLKKNVFSLKVFGTLKEILFESLLHLKVFRINFFLGFMHASLAFGWFLLIAVGNLESRLHNPGDLNLPYVPIFFKYFVPTPVGFTFTHFFAFVMDLLLLLVLTGVALAWYKRFHSRAFGFSKKPRQRIEDRIALTALWFIFPLRLLAESVTSGIYDNGSFLTGAIGLFLASHFDINPWLIPSWWAYSIALGCFFVFLPFSRYMHIPTEVLLIAMRRAGIKPAPTHNSLTDVEVHSCSRCGICIAQCQMSQHAGINDQLPVRLLYAMRNDRVEDKQAFNCLVCGRCEAKCPVGININAIRIAERNLRTENLHFNHDYLKNAVVKSADIVYFAGCMTHLTPSIKQTVEKLFQVAGINYFFLDKAGSVCCGRPFALSGQYEQADALRKFNTQAILASGAGTLVTSCPICLKSFQQEYQLGIEVIHHSDFILRLMDEKRITVEKQALHAVYHSPCELVRDNSLHNAPIQILEKMVHLVPESYFGDNSFCCGGSIANISIKEEDRDKITLTAIQKLTVNNPSILVTSCPLCKKTFAKHTDMKVMDIAQVVFSALRKNEVSQPAHYEAYKSEKIVAYAK